MKEIMKSNGGNRSGAGPAGKKLAEACLKKDSGGREVERGGGTWRRGRAYFFGAFVQSFA